ncbi:MAG: AI-2E family transporter [Bacilli bacterium]|jgi:predicted PurR-regulated permease PerM
MRNIDIKKLNEVINLSKKILRIAFILIIIIVIYVLTMLLKEWQIFLYILKIFKILLPLFFGLVIVWLLEPSVKYLVNKGVNRVLGTIFIYVLMLSFLYFGFIAFFPMFLEQTNEFIQTLPDIITAIAEWANRFLENFRHLSFLDIDLIKGDIVDYLNGLITSVTTEIPETIINFITSLISTIGIFFLGLIIGFYLLLSSEDVSKSLLTLIPKKKRTSLESLFKDINYILYSFVKGTALIGFIVFLVSSVIFSLIGVKTPLLLGLICGLTNVIPYIGPFIGGAIATIVALTQSFPLGILTMSLYTIVQTLESVVLQPLIMGRTMRLHPATVLMGLIVFGYFFGIIGMIFATPIMAILRTLFMFLENRYQFLNFLK